MRQVERTPAAGLVLREHQWSVEDRDALGMLRVDRLHAESHRDTHDHGVPRLPLPLDRGPGVRLGGNWRGLVVDPDLQALAPAWNSNVEREPAGPRHFKRQSTAVRVGKTGFLAEADLLPVAPPRRLGRHQQVDINAAAVAEVEDVVVVGDGLPVGTGAARPFVPVVLLDAAGDTVVAVVEGAPVGLGRQRRADAVVERGLDPVAESRLAGEAHEVATKLEGGPGAAWDFRVVAVEIPRPAEAAVGRHQPLVRTEPARGVALRAPQEIIGIDADAQVATCASASMPMISFGARSATSRAGSVRTRALCRSTAASAGRWISTATTRKSHAAPGPPSSFFATS